MYACTYGNTIFSGEKGMKGEQGETGATGLQGQKGEVGETGAQGIQGVVGLQGQKGMKVRIRIYIIQYLQCVIKNVISQLKIKYYTMY